MNKYFSLLFFSGSCCFAGADWSRLQNCGANISGLLARTRDIIDEYWHPFRLYESQKNPSAEELLTAINFVAAMECEQKYHRLPSQISNDLESVRERLNRYFNEEDLHEQVNDKIKYYDFFIRAPNISLPFKATPQSLALMSQWYENRKKLQAKEAQLYQPKSSTTTSQTIGGALPPPLTKTPPAQESPTAQDSIPQPIQSKDLVKLLASFPTHDEFRKIEKAKAHQFISDLRSLIDDLNKELLEKKALLARAQTLLDSAKNQNNPEPANQEKH